MENGKTKILIVDDRRDKLLVFQTILEELGQTIVTANSGEEALDQLGHEIQPELIVILSDINMPGMNGINAAYEIRRISPSTKIVFLTIHDTPAARHNTRLWSHGFVSKSAAGTELIPILTRLAGEITPVKRAKSRRVTIVKPPRPTD